VWRDPLSAGFRAHRHLLLLLLRVATNGRSAPEMAPSRSTPTENVSGGRSSRVHRDPRRRVDTGAVDMASTVRTDTVSWSAIRDWTGPRRPARHLPLAGGHPARVVRQIGSQRRRSPHLLARRSARAEDSALLLRSPARSCSATACAAEVRRGQHQSVGFELHVITSRAVHRGRRTAVADGLQSDHGSAHRF